MVKVEDCTDSGSSSDVEILERPRLQVTLSDLKPGSVPDLVDENAGPEASSSLDGFSSPEREEADSLFGSELDYNVDTEYHNTPSVQDGEKRLYLLAMNFAEEEVDLALKQLGKSASLSELADFIVTAQTAGSSGVNSMKGSESNLGKDEVQNAEALFGMMDKTNYLFQMGFTEEEVSTAIDNFGPEVSIQELADSIFASRLSYRIEKDQTVDGSNIKTELDYTDHASEELKCYHSVTEAWEACASSSNKEFYDYEENVRVKKAKGTVVDGESSFSHSAKQQARWEAAWQSKPDILGKFEMSDPVFIKKEVPEQMASNLNGNIHGILSRAPYFFFGNVVDVSRETWRRLSEFLYGAEPEFASCQFFSAFMRKEGYLHNLPSGRRFYVLPKPPVTLGEALPHTKRWWPSWDTRKQLGCINTETKVVQQVCEQLGKMMMDSQGILSKEQQANVLHQCKTLNLMWVGQYKLSPIEPDQVEGILGYPRHHTRLWGLEPDERLRALKYSFQTDTLGYYLSVLKSMFPDGMRVLSVYSGTGGAEVALHRLGVHLKCVISVEPSNINRRIIRRWWQYTGQSGELILVRGVEKLTTQMLENLVQKFGGFDLIIGGNPGPWIPGSSNASILMGMGQNPFFEFVRVFQRVRSIMGRSS
ncbi:DNA (cytosine-5-)-methyltransferase [Musa troglodytarum]|uniref:DNA (Cytosine-5-)-methyltransferase n=1 Tax=Musa troglodytarum TaxID=320322 RepID=A0A9E7IJ53_9LILI|nr:DNA (cytosine-5-)-methyltransferase [Musa troglodytarum]URE47629.1 DNA (cytosine-5-)-methyltransferase [Musa troglodytarum]